MYIFSQMNKIRFLVILSITILSPGFYANAAELAAESFFVPMVPRTSVSSENTNAFISMINAQKARGYQINVYGGRYNANGQLTSFAEYPYDHATAQQAANYLNTAVQGTNAQRIVTFEGGHGSPNGVSDAVGVNSQFNALANKVAVQDGQKITRMNNACFGGNACNDTNLFTETGPIDSVISGSLPGGKTFTDVFTKTSAADVNGDSAMSLDEIKSEVFQARDDTGHLVTYGVNKKIKPGAEDPKLLYKKDYQLEPPIPCLVSPHFYIQDYGADGVPSKQDDTYVYAENIYNKGGSVHYADGSAANITTNNAVAGSSPDGLFVSRNGHKVKIGPSRVGGTVPGNDGKYYKVTGVETVSNDLYGSGERSQNPDCVFSPEDKGSSGPEATLVAEQPAPLGGFGGGGGGVFGGLGGAGGLQSLLPLLMSGLLGGGQSQQGNQNGQGNYGAGYGNQQNQCAMQGVSPVCGNDGITYSNTCWANQLGSGVKKQGVCLSVTTTPTPSSTPLQTAILTQLTKSNIPATLINTVTTIIETLLLGIQGGTIVVPETVVQ